MIIIKKTVISCDECGYEEPNDYNCEVKNWYICEDEWDRKLHFCSKECQEYYAINENCLLLDGKVISNDSTEFQNLLL